MNKKCTILFLTRRFFPDIGGVETHVLKVSEDLIKKGFKVVVISESSNSAVNANKKILNHNEAKWQSRYIGDKIIGRQFSIDKSGKLASRMKNDESHLKLVSKSNFLINNSKFIKDIIIYRIPSVKENRLKKMHIWMWLWKNREVIKNADIVHCHDVFFWFLPFRFLYPQKPVFTTFHGYEKFPVPIKNILVRKMSEMLSFGNICIGDFIKKWYGTKPNFVSYGGVDTDLKTVKHKSRSDKLKIIFVGRLDEDTGVNLYISALKKLKEKGYPFNFEAFGDGSLRGKVEEIGSVNGFVNNINIRIADADLVFASSYLSILQSLILKKPVVAVYENKLKEDYLKISPFNQWINIVNNKNDVINIIEQFNKDRYNNIIKAEKAYNWAKNQSWKNVTELYLRLWKII